MMWPFLFSGEAVVVNPFTPGNVNQNWFIDGEVVRSCSQKDLVIGLAEESSGSVRQGPVKASVFHDGIQQKWIADYQ